MREECEMRDCPQNDLSVDHPLDKSVTPDLLNNLNVKTTENISEKHYDKCLFDHTKHCHTGGQVPFYPSKAPGKFVGSDNGSRKERKAKLKDQVVRGMCCAGWVFCFPLYCLCWAIRESPVDEEDLRHDYCYPCYN